MNTADNTEVILKLEAELDRLKDLYRTEQSLHAATERHNATLAAENAELVRLQAKAVREREEAARRAEEYRQCDIESQDWDWLTAKEENEDLGNDQFQVPDMQELFLMAHDKKPTQ